MSTHSDSRHVAREAAKEIEMSKALELADKYADAVATHRLESLYGTSKSYTLEKAKERDEAHAELAAELRRLDAENAQLRAELESIYSAVPVAWMHEERNATYTGDDVRMAAYNIPLIQKPARKS
jgi:hypothetical protein